MSIDPMNMPILGDPAPANPPRPVRLASILLLANVALTVGYGLYTEAAFDAVIVLPLGMALWFTLGVRAGWAWARAAATGLSGLSIMVMIGALVYSLIEMGSRWWGSQAAVDVAISALSVGLLATAMHLMWRTDAGEHFAPRGDSGAF